jgi:hypothetical protein
MTEKEPILEDQVSGTGPANVPAPLSFDETLRREAVQHLSDDLEIGSSLLARCEEFALQSREANLAPMHAAARLMQASAKLADSLSGVAQVERRRRSIVERIEPIDPKQRKLIETNKQELVSSNTRMKIWRRMDEHIEQSIRARCGDASASDSVARLIKEEEETIARCQRQMDETETG